MSSVTFRLISTFILYAIPLFVTLRPIGMPICDPDVWWHLSAGQWIVEHQTVPFTDPFSAYGQGKPWIAYSWLYEVLLYGLYSVFGLWGVIIYRVALSLAIAGAVHRLILRHTPPDVVAAGLTGACLLPLAMLFSERPWLFTILFGTLTLHAVLDLRENRRSVLPWLLPILFTVWANVHIQFVYGLALLVLACVAPIIDYCLGCGDEGTTAALGSPVWRWTIILTCACLLATLFNPYHVHLYGVVLEYATQPGPFQFVNELKAPEFREACDWFMLALAGATAFALGRQKCLRSFDVFLFTGCAFLSFHTRRDLWLIVLAAAAILSAGPFPFTGIAVSERCWSLRMRSVVVVMLAILAVVLIWLRDLSPSRLERIVANVFPVDAARFVAKQGYKGPLYNDFNWGGYLIRALPALPVAIDGRTNLHGDERLRRFGITWIGGPGWHDDADLAHAGVIVANREAPLASLLVYDDRFVLVYEDTLARVFIAR